MADIVSTGKFLRLAERHNELTRQTILAAALAMLERASVGELTVRAVAKQARVSERTVFRYFADREELLDAVADAVRARLALPGPPRSQAELLAAPRALYTRFEETASLTKAALHSELFHRMRETQAQARWKAVQELLRQLAPRKSERERRIAAANIRYYLAATSWHYYRFYFGFSLEETIAAAETAIRQTLDGLTAR
ncbi:MAG TPA: helix-turn-helix domain-containing protein [Burkholderiales bacterium]|nr:helix-turn-helix domain-containing protein [Burkholderiales bacterium]